MHQHEKSFFRACSLYAVYGRFEKLSIINMKKAVAPSYLFEEATVLICRGVFLQFI